MIREFKTYLVNIKGYAENTALAYEKDLKSFVSYMKSRNESARWSTISREDVDAYIIHLSNTEHKPATICRNISSISALYKYMKREGYEVTDPAKYESRPKIGQHLVNTIPVDDLTMAMAKAQGIVKTMIRIIAETGIRVQEMLDIKESDIDFKTGAIRIHGKGNKERMVYVNQDTLNMMRSQNSMSNRSYFGEITQREVRKQIWEALKDHTNAKQLSPHAIRHTYATEMAKRGMSATTLQKALGHEHLETTQRYIDYAQVGTEQEIRELSIFN